MNNKTETTLIIISFILVVASLFLAPLLFGIIAIILCVVALVKNSKTNTLSNGKKWLAYISIILAIISMAYAVLIVKNQVTGLIDNAKQELDTAAVKSRDAKRIADARILNTTIQIYALDTEKLPIAKDEKNNFRPFKLIKGSPDFTSLESEIKGNDSSQYITADPSDPERYYEYFSDGKIYTIKAYLEQTNVENCKEVKSGYCEFEIKGDLASALGE
ncbi:MAG: DUF4190 domain-containing protein [Patescibacteria group bacterium]